MPIVKMTKTQKGSLNGIQIKKFIKGRVYTLNDDLTNVFVNIIKCAEPMPIKREPPKEVQEKILEVPINKAEAVVPEVKNEYAENMVSVGSENMVSKSQTRRMEIMKKKKGNKKK